MLKSSYIKTHICEYFFTLMISFGLVINVASSFIIDEEVFNNFLLIAAIVAVLNLLLFVAGMNKKATIAGIVLYVLAACTGVLYMISTGKIAELEGETSGYTLMIVIAVLCTTAVYLVTRNRKIFVAFIPVALIVCAAFRFLEYPVSVPGFILMITGMVLELVYKVYYDSIVEATIGSYNIRHFIIQSLAVVLIVSCISYPIYTFAIKPANLPTRDIKLITKLLSWDVVEKIGISSKTEVLSNAIKSDKITDKELPNEEPQEKPDREKDEDIKQKEKTELPAFAIKYDYKEPDNLWMISFIAIIPVIPLMVKYFFRKKRRKKVESLAPTEGCLYLYEYFLKRFKIAKLAKPDNLTLLEYVANNSDALSAFDLDSGIGFDRITDIYTKEVYGGYVPDENDYKMFKDFYYGFFKNMKKYIGKLKYMFKFWFL